MNTEPLEVVLDRILRAFAAKYEAREVALSACRQTIRFSANAIRAAHRADLDGARWLLDQARDARDAAVAALAQHPDIYHAGFVHDAQKEYAEGETLWALACGRPLPEPEALAVEFPAYLNGIAEATGELRRMILDRLRLGHFTGCEAILQAMDDIYSALVTVDFPDAMTAGLRRTTDQTRGILERTRGDLTMAALRFQPLESAGTEAAPGRRIVRPSRNSP